MRETGEHDGFPHLRLGACWKLLRSALGIGQRIFVDRHFAIVWRGVGRGGPAVADFGDGCVRIGVSPRKRKPGRSAGDAGGKNEDCVFHEVPRQEHGSADSRIANGRIWLTWRISGRSTSRGITELMRTKNFSGHPK